MTPPALGRICSGRHPQWLWALVGVSCPSPGGGVFTKTIIGSLTGQSPKLSMGRLGLLGYLHIVV